MTDRNPIDVETIRNLTEENAKLTLLLGQAQRRVADLERQLGPDRGKDRMEEFACMRRAALENGKSGVFSP